MTVVERVARDRSALPARIPSSGPTLLPLDAGEQYRFGFDMGACIGCHSCEVACAEQNANPPGVNWRRVGEIEGGAYPHARRLHLSMACNHCLEPTCLRGCPTNAYVKLANGIVKHQAEECIGCQYCIWNCPYEVPVFNPQRRIVTKCDMCLPRLETGQLPACVLACPTGAITVEVVSTDAWRSDHAQADAPGLPSADITLSTTRIALHPDAPQNALAVNDEQVEPQDPHWPLVALTLLTQLAVGTMCATVVLGAVLHARPSGAGSARVLGPALAAFGAGAVALAASILHLGRPSQAWKALRNVRRSWLSREVALFSAFFVLSIAYCLALALRGPAVGIGAAAAAVGLAGIYASGRLYLVPARPVWNSPRTLVSFLATGVAGGPLATVLAIGRGAPSAGWVHSMLAVGLVGIIVQLATYQHLATSIIAHSQREYRGTARLLFRRYRGHLAARIGAALVAVACLVAALVLTPGRPPSVALVGVAMGCAGLGELIGRWLFFVTVVPMTTAGTFFRGRA